MWVYSYGCESGAKSLAVLLSIFANATNLAAKVWAPHTGSIFTTDAVAPFRFHK
jgi:hypothetical protein